MKFTLICKTCGKEFRVDDEELWLFESCNPDGSWDGTYGCHDCLDKETEEED